MVPSAKERYSRQHQATQALLNKKSAIIPRQQQTQLQEITRDLLNRQYEYDKLNKVYTSIKFNHTDNTLDKNSKFFTIKNAVREARQKFLENKDYYQQSIQKHENRYFQQQKRSIALIAQIFRNQKSALNLRQNHQHQKTKKWNLQSILIIAIPMICLLILIIEFNEQK